MECAYFDCPLREDCDDPEQLRFRYSSIKFVPCGKCSTVFYCSSRCAQCDWFHKHQFQCKDGFQNNGVRLEYEDVQRIEETSPFIKEGYYTNQQDALDVSLDGHESGQQLKMEDIEFLSGGKILGKGSYGEVELAIHKKSGKQLALKKIDKHSLRTQKIQATLLREVDIHKRLKHENIIRLYQSLEDKDFLYLVLEYAAKGNLFYLIRNKKTLSEDEAFYFFIQTCQGLYFLHKNGLIHRDIKPENLLIDEENILKICDFGWCVQMNTNEQRKTYCGTLEYMAPEMLQNNPHNYTLDIWAIGILLFELVHGQAPFQGETPREICQKIVKNNIKFSTKCSEEYKDLVKRLLVIEPMGRLPLIKVFDHPWVKKFQIKYNLKKTAPRTSQRKSAQIVTQPNVSAEPISNPSKQPLYKYEPLQQKKVPLNQKVEEKKVDDDEEEEEEEGLTIQASDNEQQQEKSLSRLMTPISSQNGSQIHQSKNPFNDDNITPPSNNSPLNHQKGIKIGGSQLNQSKMSLLDGGKSMELSDYIRMQNGFDSTSQGNHSELQVVNQDQNIKLPPPLSRFQSQYSNHSQKQNSQQSNLTKNDYFGGSMRSKNTDKQSLINSQNHYLALPQQQQQNHQHQNLQLSQIMSKSASQKSVTVQSINSRQNQNHHSNDLDIINQDIQISAHQPSEKQEKTNSRELHLDDTLQNNHLDDESRGSNLASVKEYANTQQLDDILQEIQYEQSHNDGNDNNLDDTQSPKNMLHSSKQPSVMYSQQSRGMNSFNNSSQSSHITQTMHQMEPSLNNIKEQSIIISQHQSNKNYHPSANNSKIVNPPNNAYMMSQSNNSEMMSQSNNSKIVNQSNNSKMMNLGEQLLNQSESSRVDNKQQMLQEEELIQIQSEPEQRESRYTGGDVMQEIEDFVKQMNDKKRSDRNSIYDLCNEALDDLDELEESISYHQISNQKIEQRQEPISIEKKKEEQKVQQPSIRPNPNQKKANYGRSNNDYNYFNDAEIIIKDDSPRISDLDIKISSPDHEKKVILPPPVEEKKISQQAFEQKVLQPEIEKKVQLQEFEKKMELPVYVDKQAQQKTVQQIQPSTSEKKFQAPIVEAEKQVQPPIQEKSVYQSQIQQIQQTVVERSKWQVPTIESKQQPQVDQSKYEPPAKENKWFAQDRQVQKPVEQIQQPLVVEKKVEVVSQPIDPIQEKPAEFTKNAILDQYQKFLEQQQAKPKYNYQANEQKKAIVEQKPIEIQGPPSQKSPEAEVKPLNLEKPKLDQQPLIEEKKPLQKQDQPLINPVVEVKNESKSNHNRQSSSQLKQEEASSVVKKNSVITEKQPLKEPEVVVEKEKPLTEQEKRRQIIQKYVSEQKAQIDKKALEQFLPRDKNDSYIKQEPIISSYKKPEQKSSPSTNYSPPIVEQQQKQSLEAKFNYQPPERKSIFGQQRNTNKQGAKIVSSSTQSKANQKSESEINDSLTKKKYDEKPVITMRPTDLNTIDFEPLRKAQLQNLSSLYDNLEMNLVDSQHIKSEVDDYMKASKNYKYEYKENVKQINSNKPQPKHELFLDEYTTKGEDKETAGEQKDEYDALWNPQRRNTNFQNIQGIPLNEENQQRWLESRKLDTHLDLDFLPKQIAYNFDDNLADQNKMMQQIIQEMIQINEQYKDEDNYPTPYGADDEDEEEQKVTPNKKRRSTNRNNVSTSQKDLSMQNTFQMEFFDEQQSASKTWKNIDAIKEPQFKSQRVPEQEVEVRKTSNKVVAPAKESKQDLARESQRSMGSNYSRNIFSKIKTENNSIANYSVEEEDDEDYKEDWSGTKAGKRDSLSDKKQMSSKNGNSNNLKEEKMSINQKEQQNPQNVHQYKEDESSTEQEEEASDEDNQKGKQENSDKEDEEEEEEEEEQADSEENEDEEEDDDEQEEQEQDSYEEDEEETKDKFEKITFKKPDEEDDDEWGDDGEKLQELSTFNLSKFEREKQRLLIQQKNKKHLEEMEREWDDDKDGSDNRNLSFWESLAGVLTMGCGTNK